MAQLPKITLEIAGMEEVKQLLDRQKELTAALAENTDRLNCAALSVQAKINQPQAGTNG